MRTITLKTDDDFFDKVTRLSQELYVTKSEFIRKAISEYEKSLEKKKLQKQLERASYALRDYNSKIIKEFDDTISDGL